MFWGEGCSLSSLQARGNAREILNAAPAMVLHGIECAVGGGEKFLGRIPILRESRHSRAHGKRRVLQLGRETFADSRDYSRGQVLAGFPQHQSEFVAAVSCGGGNRAWTIAQKPAGSPPRPAARGMPLPVRVVLA